MSLLNDAFYFLFLNLPKIFFSNLELEGTHRVKTHAVLLLTLTLTLTFQSKNHVTCRISQGYSLYQVWSWTLWDHSFLSYAPDISVKNALIDPVALTFEPQNSISFLGYPKILSVCLSVLMSVLFIVLFLPPWWINVYRSTYQIRTLWDHSFLSYAADKQTNRQTDGLEHHIHANRHSRRWW